MLTQNKPFFIAGPVGQLETLYMPAQGVERGIAIVNHPNPTQGGTFTNKVIQTAAKVLAQLGYHCYLPNLRGTGRSDGQHDYGAGETEDCVAVIDYARAQHPQAGQLIIAGFSFGGYVSTFASQQRTPDLLLLIGAAVGHYTHTPAPHAPNPDKTLVIHGADDEVVELAKPLKWAAEQDLAVIVVPDSSHFFHGKLIQLRETLARYVPPVLGITR